MAMQNSGGALLSFLVFVIPRFIRGIQTVHHINHSIQNYLFNTFNIRSSSSIQSPISFACQNSNCSYFGGTYGSDRSFPGRAVALAKAADLSFLLKPGSSRRNYEGTCNGSTGPQQGRERYVSPDNQRAEFLSGSESFR